MKFEIYATVLREDSDTRQIDVGWYWRLRARNGRIVADGAEAYATRSGVRRACWRLQEVMLYAGRPLDIVEVES
jgi:uncharacterized protein YegP (UPF0339 family)